MDVLTLRKKLRMNQVDFWARVAVTQSGGSRYESGRAIPRPVQMLLDIAYGTDQKARKTMNRLQGVK